MNSQEYIVNDENKVVKIDHSLFDLLLKIGYRKGRTLEEQLEDIRNRCRQLSLCGGVETDSIVLTWFMGYIEDIKERLFSGVGVGIKIISKEELEQMKREGGITEI